MYALGLRTGEIRLLKFDDVNNQEQPTIKVYKAHKGKVKQIEISQALYDEIKNYENELIMKEKYDKTIRKNYRKWRSSWTFYVYRLWISHH